MSTVNVQFTGTWLTNLVTGEELRLLKQTRERKHASTGQVVSYAGRNVIESTTQRTAQTPLLFVRVTPADAVTLESWETVPLLLRDGFGWYRTGTFFDVDTTNVDPAGLTVQVAVTWQDSAYELGV